MNRKNLNLTLTSENVEENTEVSGLQERIEKNKRELLVMLSDKVRQGLQNRRLYERVEEKDDDAILVKPELSYLIKAFEQVLIQKQLFKGEYGALYKGSLEKIYGEGSNYVRYVFLGNYKKGLTLSAIINHEYFSSRRDVGGTVYTKEIATLVKNLVLTCNLNNDDVIICSHDRDNRQVPEN